VDRWIREKIAQNVAQPIVAQNKYVTFTVETVAQTFGLLL
jgi:hypothetical protein